MVISQGNAKQAQVTARVPARMTTSGRCKRGGNRSGWDAQTSSLGAPSGPGAWETVLRFPLKLTRTPAQDPSNALLS